MTPRPRARKALETRVARSGGAASSQGPPSGSKVAAGHAGPPSGRTKGGRPPVVLGARELREIETLVGYGLTQAQVAHVLGIGASTLREKTHVPEVAAAVERGRAQAEAKIAAALFEKAVGGDMQAIRWWEMTRAGRSERQETAGTLGTFDLENMTDAQLARLAAGESPARVLRGK